MKKRIMIVMALVMALVMLMPSVALAAKPVPFNAEGVISSISPGTVAPSGDSGRFRIVERQIEGVVSGDINGGFVLTYKGNVDLATQAGNVHGRITAGDYVFEMNGKVLPMEMVPVWPEVYLPKLTVSGQCTLVGGKQGTGDLTAWAIFIPTPEGHVGTIVASYVELTGQWQP